MVGSAFDVGTTYRCKSGHLRLAQEQALEFEWWQRTPIRRRCTAGSAS